MQEVCSATRSSNRTIKCPSTLLLLYRHVIGHEVGDLGKVIRARNEILVRDGKGAKDRITMLPELLKKPLQDHLRKVKAAHERDLAEGWGRVQMPDALDRKYPTRPPIGAGNRYSRWRTGGRTRKPPKMAGITWMNPLCNELSKRL